MNCRHCGARLASDDLVCGSCGNIVDTAPPTPTTTSRPIPRTPPPKSRRASAATLVILAYACGFLGLIVTAGLGGVYAGLQDRKADDPRLPRRVPELSGTSFGWDLITREGQAVATGLYLFAVEDRATGERHVGKFLIVKSDREGFQ